MSRLLESDGTKPYELSTGWLGRALAAQAPRAAHAVSFGQQTRVRSRARGHVWYWGVHPGNGNLPLVLVPTRLTTIDGVVEIDSCTRSMLRADGTVWGVGYRNAGVLAGGTDTGDLTAVAAPGIDFD